VFVTTLSTASAALALPDILAHSVKPISTNALPALV
jgi:hypothetical protein